MKKNIFLYTLAAFNLLLVACKSNSDSFSLGVKFNTSLYIAKTKIVDSKGRFMYYKIVKPFSSNEKLDVLDEYGFRKGYQLPRKEIHEKGELHRAVHLYVFNKNGSSLLLQKRSANVDHYPNKYSISVVGHVNAGESSYQAARRELKEELNLKIKTLMALNFMFSFRQDATLAHNYIDRQFNDVYTFFIDYIEPKNIKFDKHDVAKVKWVLFEDFKKMVEDKDSELAPVYSKSCKDLVYFLENKNN